MAIDIRDIKTLDELVYQVMINPSAYAGKAGIINKFGYNLDIDSTKADVWSAGGNKTDRYPSDAGIIEVVSSSTADTANGTGAQAVVVLGYSSEYGFISDWQELNGQTAVELDLPGMDVYRAYVTRAGSGGKNAGDVTIRHKTGPVTLAQIPTGFNQTQMSHFIVPNGYTGFFLDGSAKIGGIQGGGGSRVGDLHLEIMTNNGVWRITETFGGTSDSGAVPFKPDFPLKLPERTRIKASCTAELANTKAYVQYNILMINNSLIT